MMKKNYSHVTTFIILFSIVTVILQFTAYYFVDSFLLTLGISSILCLLCDRILLQLTNNYGACFSYSLLNVLLCSIILLLSYLGNTQGLFPFEEKLYFFLLINWLVPHLNSIFSDMADTSYRITGFKEFFRNSSIVFSLFYLLGVLIFLFLNNTDYFIIDANLSTINIIPFYTLATLIENHISDQGSLTYVRTYLLQGIIPYIPYGFYTILLLRHQTRLLRFVALILFPFAIEALQRLTLLGKADVEEVLLGLLGGFIGALIYHGLNTLHNYAKGRDFLTEQTRFHYYKDSYRF
ncbi:MAG: putative rane protein [Anaerocolumna sp.]|jgi:glycopeptide antibiotics resistance protein|nr:putative rane protein [Anaerocolumna sp.]